jgi:putative transposase
LKFINAYKSASSRLIKKRISGDPKKKLWKEAFWKIGYFISTTIGANLETVTNIYTKTKTMKTGVKSYKIRIYPNKSVQDKLQENFGCSRFVFNQLLSYNKLIFGTVVNNPRINPYNYKPKINRVTLNNWLKLFKTEYSFLKYAESTSLQSTCDIFKDSMIRFFKGQNNFPRFKSRKNPVQSIRLKNNNNSIRFEKNKIRLPRFGLVRYKDNREILGNILSATVKCENSRWFTVINCKNVPIKTLPKTGDNVGIDL